MGWLSGTILGIGRSAEERLRQVGITTPRALAEIDVAAVAGVARVSVHTLELAKYLAERLPDGLIAQRLEVGRGISGLGPKSAASLWADGIRSLRDLRALDPGTFGLDHLPNVDRERLRDWHDMAHLQVLGGMTPRAARALLGLGVRRPADLLHFVPVTGPTPIPGVSHYLLSAWRRVAACLPAGASADELELVKGVLGIGAKLGTALFAEGLRSLGDLRNADPRAIDLSWVPGFTPQQLVGWQRMARLQLIGGVGPAFSRLLHDAGYATFDALIRETPGILLGALHTAAAGLETAPAHLPTLEDVTGWLTQAMELRAREVLEAAGGYASQAREILSADGALHPALATLLASGPEARDYIQRVFDELDGDPVSAASAAGASSASPPAASTAASASYPDLLSSLQRLGQDLPDLARWTTRSAAVIRYGEGVLSLGAEIRGLEDECLGLTEGIAERLALEGQAPLSGDQVASIESLRARAGNLLSRLQEMSAEPEPAPVPWSPSLDRLFSLTGSAGASLSPERIAGFVRLGGIPFQADLLRDAGTLTLPEPRRRLSNLGADLLPRLRSLLEDKATLLTGLEADLGRLVVTARNPGDYADPQVTLTLDGQLRESASWDTRHYGEVENTVGVGVAGMSYSTYSGWQTAPTLRLVSGLARLGAWLGTVPVIGWLILLVFALLIALALNTLNARRNLDTSAANHESAQAHSNPQIVFPTSPLSLDDVDRLISQYVSYLAGLSTLSEWLTEYGRCRERQITFTVYEGRNTCSARACVQKGHFRVTGYQIVAAAAWTPSMKEAVTSRAAGWRTYARRDEPAIMGEAMAKLMFESPLYGGLVHACAARSGWPDFRVDFPGRPMVPAEAKGTYLPGRAPISAKLWVGRLRNLRNLNTGWVTCYPVATKTIYAVYWDHNPYTGETVNTYDPETARLEGQRLYGDGEFGSAWMSYEQAGLGFMALGRWADASTAFGSAREASARWYAAEEAPYDPSAMGPLEALCESLRVGSPTPDQLDGLRGADALGAVDWNSENLALARAILERTRERLVELHLEAPREFQAFAREITSVTENTPSVTSFLDAAAASGGGQATGATLTCVNLQDGYAWGYFLGPVQEASLGEALTYSADFDGPVYSLRRGSLSLVLHQHGLTVPAGEGAVSLPGGTFSCWAQAGPLEPDAVEEMLLWLRGTLEGTT